MAILHFGVVELPYASGKGRAKKAPSSTTTGDVASILEKNYGLFQTFFDTRKRDIAKSLERSYAGALNSIMNGAPPTLNPAGSAISEIEQMFREMVTLKQFDGRIKGVPTQASLDGVSHRFKRPYKTGRKRGPRPSFRDTGLFLNAVRVWID